MPISLAFRLYTRHVLHRYVDWSVCTAKAPIRFFRGSTPVKKGRIVADEFCDTLDIQQAANFDRFGLLTSILLPITA